jgi:hypothetical protein
MGQSDHVWEVMATVVNNYNYLPSEKLKIDVDGGS